MIPILHAAWLVSPAGQSPDDVVDAYFDAIGAIDGVAATGVYSVVGGEQMEKVAAVLTRLDNRRLRAKPPVAIALSRLDSLAPLGELGRRLGTSPEEGPSAPSLGFVAAQAVYQEAGGVEGPDVGDAPTWAPAVQFGALNTDG